MNDARRLVIDWGSRTVLTEAGEYVNLHAELDRCGQERLKSEHNLHVAEGEWRGAQGKAWLDYRARDGGEKRSVAELDKMVDRDVILPETPVGHAWQTLLAAQARAKADAEQYWTLKRLVDLDIKYMT